MFDYMLTKEQLKIRDEARELVKWVPRQMILDMDTDTIKFPKEFLAEGGQAQPLRLPLPETMGWPRDGLGDDVRAHGGDRHPGIRICLRIRRRRRAGLRRHHPHGTEAQKEKYVKPLLRGELFAAECLTEPRGGSDFFGATTRAEHRGDHFLVNGQKRFIVGGEGADYFLLYARTNFDPAAKSQDSLTALIVDRGPGVETKYLYGLMGCRGGGTARLVFKDAKVPKENVIGKINGAYDVFNTMMIPERLGTASMTIGAARPALDIATNYTSRRKAFGQVIAQFEGVSFQIAEAVMLLDAARAMAYVTARAVDAGVDMDRLRRMVSESKKFITESCQKAVHNAMQVMGGIGYTNVFPIERIFRDVRLASIWTGTSEVMSMITAHEWYREFFKTKTERLARDFERDAQEADAADEIIYE